MCASIWVRKPGCGMKVKLGCDRVRGNTRGRAASSGRTGRGLLRGQRISKKHTCRDPKDDELCLNRVKPEETLVEARSGSDVQIDRRIWV